MYVAENFQFEVTDLAIEVLATHCTSLIYISLSECKDVTDWGINALAKNCTSLTTILLDFSFAFSVAGIKALAKNFIFIDNSQFRLLQAGHGRIHRGFGPGLHVIDINHHWGLLPGHGCRKQVDGLDLQTTDTPRFEPLQPSHRCGH